MKPRLLDLFGGADGAGWGYHLAGFHVTGVDIEQQPNSRADVFIHSGSLAYLERLLWERSKGIPIPFDVIHASPPCQAFTSARVIHGRHHDDLLTPTRTLLEQTDLPWVIENVPGAPMRSDLVLCGSQFPDLCSENGQLVRHRLFEFFDPAFAERFGLSLCCDHSRPTISVFGHGGHIYHGKADWQKVMGIDWMTRDEMAQAIPPRFTELIGAQLLQHIQGERAA